MTKTIAYNEEKLVQELPLPYKQVYTLLSHGKENSITSNLIAKRTGLSTTGVRSIIHDLITKYGLIIGGCNERKNQGYYIPVTEREELDALKNLTSRAYHLNNRIAALEKSMALRKA